MPPSGGALGTSGSTAGQRDQPKSACSGLPSSAVYTNGQFVMNPAFAALKADCVTPSTELPSAADAADECASRAITRAAARPAAESIAGTASLPASAFSRIAPPADATSELISTE